MLSGFEMEYYGDFFWLFGWLDYLVVDIEGFVCVVLVLDCVDFI